MPRPRKGEERRIQGVRKKTYTKKDGTVSVYWQYLVSVPGPDGQPKLEWRNAPSQRAAEEARAERKARRGGIRKQADLRRVSPGVAAPAHSVEGASAEYGPRLRDGHPAVHRARTR
jgi:hypothetical protein